MAIIAQYNLTTDLKDSISGEYLDVNAYTESNLNFSAYGTSGFTTEVYATTLNSPFQQLNGDFTVDVLVEYSKEQINSSIPGKQCIFRSSYSDATYEGWENNAFLDIDLSMEGSMVYLSINGMILEGIITYNEDYPNLITIVRRDDEIFLFCNGQLGAVQGSTPVSYSIDVTDFSFSPIGIFQIGYTDDPQNVEPLFPNCIPFNGKIKKIIVQNEDVVDLDVFNITGVQGFNPFIIDQHSLPNLIGGYGLSSGFYYKMCSNFLKNHTSSSPSEPYSETLYYSITGENPFSNIGNKDFSLAIRCTLQPGLDIQTIISYGYNGCETFCIKFLNNESLYFSGGIQVLMAPELIGTTIDICYARRNGYISIAINDQQKFSKGELVNNVNYSQLGTLAYGQNYDPTINGDESFSGNIQLIRFLSIFSYTGYAGYVSEGIYTIRKDGMYSRGQSTPIENLLIAFFDKDITDSSGFKNDLEENNPSNLTPIVIDSNGITNLGRQIYSEDLGYVNGLNPIYHYMQDWNSLVVKNYMNSPGSNITNNDFVLNFKINFGLSAIDELNSNFRHSYSDQFTGYHTFLLPVKYCNVIGGPLLTIGLDDTSIDFIILELETYIIPQRIGYAWDSDYHIIYNNPTHIATNLKVTINTSNTHILKASVSDCFDGNDHEISLIFQNNQITLLIDGIDIAPDIVSGAVTDPSIGIVIPDVFEFPVNAPIPPNFPYVTISATATPGDMQNVVDLSITDDNYLVWSNQTMDFTVGASHSLSIYDQSTLLDLKIKQLRIVKNIDNVTDWSLIDSSPVDPNEISFSYCENVPPSEEIIIIGGSGNSTDTEQPGDGSGGGGGEPPFIPPKEPEQKVCKIYLCPGDEIPTDIELGPNEVICIKPYCPPGTGGGDPKEIPVKLAQTTLGKKLFLELDAAPTSGDGYQAAIGSVALVDVSGVGKLYTKTGTSATSWTEGAGGGGGSVTQQYVDSADNALSGRISTLEGQSSSTNGQISTINGQISTINSDISTLQSNQSSFATTTYVDMNAAKTDLSNLSNPALVSDLKPATNEGSNLGIPGTRFNAIRAKTAYLADIQDSANIPVVDVTNRVLKDSSGTILFDFSTGVVSFKNKRITEVADPTSAQDGATKNYVDNKVALGFQSITFSNGSTTSITSRFVYVSGGSGTGIHMVQLPSNASMSIGTQYIIENMSVGVVVVLNSSGSQMALIPKNFTGILTSNDQGQGWTPSVSQLLESLISTKNITGSTVINWADSSNFYVETSASTAFTFDPNVPIQNGQRITIAVKNTSAGNITPTYGGLSGPTIAAGATAAITIMKINSVYIRVAVTNPAG